MQWMARESTGDRIADSEFGAASGPVSDIGRGFLTGYSRSRLWNKAWRESRVRFLLILTVLVSTLLYAVLFYRPDEPYHEHVWKIVYSGKAKGLFAMLVLFLGLGGLLRERAHHTTTFTLVLPVSRLELVISHILVGLIQVAVLSLLPAFSLTALSPLVHQSYPAFEALQYSILWFVCGSLIFSLAYLSSVIFAGEYTAPAVAFTAMFSYLLLAGIRPLRPYRLNFLVTMNGLESLHVGSAPEYLFTGHLPWMKLFVISLVAVGFLVIAFRITERQDF